MSMEFTLNELQRQRVEDHLALVEQVLRRSIKTNETVDGMGHDDLYQEGCIALCRAAVSYWHFLYISIALAAERSCMAEVHVFGRVTNDLQLKMSHRQVPYVSFGLVEWIGRRDTGHRQYFEVWAWGTDALSLADAEIHKDSRIWVQGFLELVDCTRNGGSEKDKRLKLSLTGWQTKPPRTAQRPARKQSPGAAQPPLPPVEVVDGDRERLPE